MAVTAPRRATVLPTAVAAAAGATLSVQAYANGRLGGSIGSAEMAGVINNAVGLAAIVVVAIAVGALQRALRSLDGVRPWQFFGGLAGAMYVTAGAVGVPKIGVALLTVALVCGQTAGSLVVDAAALSPAGRRRITTRRLVGVALTIAAVAASARGTHGTLHVGILVLALAAGFSSSVQQAANGHVARATGEPLFAGALNFAVGLCALLVVGAVADGLTPPNGWSAPPLEYLGGLAGITIVCLLAVIVARLGVLRMMLALTAGQLAGGLGLDLIAPAHGRTVSAGTVAGVALACAAVLVSGRGSRPPT